MNGLRRIQHLVTRFFGAVFSRPLRPSEQEWVSRHLGGSEARLFWDQQAIDQRHAHTVAVKVSEAGQANVNAVAAALLHDVGKRHSRLGPIARSLATVADVAHLPLPERWRIYRDHGTVGAQDLESIGADALAVAFAAGAEGSDPATMSLLRAADDGVLKAPVSDDSGNTMPPEVSQ